MGAVATLDREIDRLFARPLDEFTAGRNELAKRLKKDGETEAAERVAGMAKPSVPVWTINQLARKEKPSIKTLLDSAAKLRKTQERALAGGRADDLRAAQADEREAIRELMPKAGAILEGAGRPASRAILERIRTTLSAAALTEPGRTALKSGRLTDELEASGFDAMAGIAVPRRAPPKDELAERREKKAEREREHRRLEKRARELEAAAEEAEEEADRAEEAASKAREIAEERRRAADAAASELTQFDEAG
jgi:hypothetical protein